jgi:hypothetical protein
MKRLNLNGILDEILEAAFSEALASLKAEASGIVAAGLRGALEARLKALLAEGVSPSIEAPGVAPVRARAKATPVEAPVPEAEAPEAAPKAPRRRAKAKAATTTPEADMATLMASVEAALAKYDGLGTPKGKPLPQVLARRVRKVLEHAQDLGRNDLASLARSALAVISTDPKGVAMASWQSLAARLGLPIPVAQA